MKLSSLPYRYCSTNLQQCSFAEDYLECLVEIDIDLMQVLAQLPAPRYYWRSRSQRNEVLGFGHNVLVQGSTSEVLSRANHEFFENTSQAFPCSFVGLPFEADSAADELWGGLAKAFFVVPACLVARLHGSCTALFVHKSSTEGQDIKLFLSAIHAAAESQPTSTSSMCQRIDKPDFSGWSKTLKEVLSLIDQGTVEKIVPARQTTVRFDKPLCAGTLLGLLSQGSNHHYRILFQHEESRSFLSISPEQLFSLHETEVRTEAIAGTVPRTAQHAEQALIENERMRREQHVVLEDIQRRLSHCCTAVESDKAPHVIDFKNVSHLRSEILARKNSAATLADLAAAIHPSPAVCGFPREKAEEFIRFSEPFQRGLYAAPVGVVHANSAELAVGIRSAVVEENAVHVFAGAGIVEGADIQFEWDELDYKIRAFLDVFHQIGAGVPSTVWANRQSPASA